MPPPPSGAWHPAQLKAVLAHHVGERPDLRRVALGRLPAPSVSAIVRMHGSRQVGSHRIILSPQRSAADAPASRRPTLRPATPPAAPRTGRGAPRGPLAAARGSRPTPRGARDHLCARPWPRRTRAQRSESRGVRDRHRRERDGSLPGEIAADRAPHHCQVDVARGNRVDDPYRRVRLPIIAVDHVPDHVVHDPLRPRAWAGGGFAPSSPIRCTPIRNCRSRGSCIERRSSPRSAR